MGGARVAWVLSMLIGLLALLTALAEPAMVDVIPHRAEPPAMLMHASLIPMGFSPGGRMAVLYLPPDEAIGCFLWELRIIDLVTDTVRYTEKWQMEDCERITDLPTLLASRGGRFSALLAEHGIQGEPGSLQPLPIPAAAPVTVRLITGPLSVTDGDTAEAEVRVVALSGGGEKDVGTLRITTQYGLPMTWGHEVLGYIQSPHEARAAVVVREIHRGWEGLPTVEVIHLFGVALDRGFR